MIVAYYTTWDAPWVSKPEDLNLARIPEKYPGVDCVNISFAKPDMEYTYGRFEGTGLQFSMEFQVVVGAIKILRAKGVTVMLSIGGGSYWHDPKKYNVSSCVQLCHDLGCDGIDIDWEGHVDRDYELTSAIKETKKASSKLLSFAGFSTGAYPPQQGDPFMGMNIAAMKAVGNLVDWVNIMTYDAGPTYNPCNALDNYRLYYKGPLNVGYEIGEQAWGGYLITVSDVSKWALYYRKENIKNGCFVWRLGKQGNPSDVEVLKIAKDIFKPLLIPPVVITPPSGTMSMTCPSCKTVFVKK